MCWAYGRAASAAAWARRSFEAATICMALVIFWVALVAAMRTRMSLRLGISDVRCQMTDDSQTEAFCPLTSDSCPRSSECLCILIHGRLELAGGGIVEIPRLTDGVENVGILRAQEAEQPVLERTHAVDRDGIEVAVDAGIDDDDLLLHLERRELRLLEQLGQPRAAIEKALRGGIEV